jgi:long-chain fatty acid transport protein
MTILFTAVMAASQVNAGGLWITEYGQPTMGRAGAGETAGNGNATDAFFNPASMSRLKASDLTLTAGIVAPEVKFDVDEGSALNGTNNGGNAAAIAPLASAFYVRPLNEKWTAGLSMVGLTGSVLDYNNQWAGRYQVQEVSILVIGLVPSLAYKVTDKFSVGLSIPVMYSDLDMDIAIPNPNNPLAGPDGKAKVDGDDVQVAGGVSFFYEFSDRTRIGGRYTSKFDFEYDGDAEIDPVGASISVETEVTMASIIRIGLAHDFNETWSGYVTLGWDNWSELGSIILSTNTGGISLPRKWEDTYHYAIGADYRMDKHWTLRAGIAFDTDPTEAKNRTADMPLDEQYRFAFGADYLRDSGMKISGSLVYADYGDGAIDASRQGPLVGYKGDYQDNQIWFASVAFNWPWGGISR